MALKDKADALLQGAASCGDVPGVVAAATTRDETIYEGGFGERVRGGGAAMTPDTVGWIASMTKAITATVRDGMASRHQRFFVQNAKAYINGEGLFILILNLRFSQG